MAVALDEVTRKLLDGRNFASVATLNPDGGPQASVVWILRDGDTVLVLVDQKGAACHTGTRTCFDDGLIINPTN